MTRSIEPGEVWDMAIARLADRIAARVAELLQSAQGERREQGKPFVVQRQEDQLLHTKQEAARLLRISVETVNRLIAKQEIGICQVESQVRIPHEEVVRFSRKDLPQQESKA